MFVWCMQFQNMFSSCIYALFAKQLANTQISNLPHRFVDTVWLKAVCIESALQMFIIIRIMNTWYPLSIRSSCCTQRSAKDGNFEIWINIINGGPVTLYQQAVILITISIYPILVLISTYMRQSACAVINRKSFSGGHCFFINTRVN